jgi:hypothetical protein
MFTLFQLNNLIKNKHFKLLIYNTTLKKLFDQSYIINHIQFELTYMSLYYWTLSITDINLIPNIHPSIYAFTLLYILRYTSKNTRFLTYTSITHYPIRILQ